MEYLLLIGGGVLISTIVLVLTLPLLSPGGALVEDNISEYQNQLTLEAYLGQTNEPPVEGDVTPPVVSLLVSPEDEETELSISVTEADSSHVFYIIFRSTIQAELSAIPSTLVIPPGSVIHSTTIPSNTLDFFTDDAAGAGLENGTEYYYMVASCDAVPNCGYSPIVSAIPEASSPPSPTETTPPQIALEGMWDDTENTVTINITEAASGPVTFAVFQSTDGVQIENVIVNSPTDVTFPIGTVNLQYIGTTGPAPVNFQYVHTDGGLANGTPYYYIVAACDSAPIPNCEISTKLALTPNVPELLFAFGEAETVFDWSSERCEVEDIPDLPAHAVRWGSKLVVYAGMYKNYLLVGNDFDSLSKSCNGAVPALNSGPALGGTNTAASFNNAKWIGALFNDGSKIHMISHNEYHDTTNGAPCTSSWKPNNPCWYNAFTYGSANLSSNGIGGNLFTQSVAPNHVAIAPALQWSHHAMAAPAGGPYAYGYMNPTNIIEKDGFYYIMFASVATTGSGTSGTCIARTNNLNDPSTWRAWNGDFGNPQFNIPTHSPYHLSNPAHAPCVPFPFNILQVTKNSLTYNTFLGKYFLMNSGSYWEGGTKYCGIYYSTSDDLVNWEVVKKMTPFPLGGTDTDCVSAPPYAAYASIIDHDSTDPNFNTVDDTFYLYWSRTNGPGQSFIPDADLVRQPASMCWSNDPECDIVTINPSGLN